MKNFFREKSVEENKYTSTGIKFWRHRAQWKLRDATNRLYYLDKTRRAGIIKKNFSLGWCFDLNEKLITVITTVYNKAPFLKTWAESVASQTYLDKARILVIDDGSTDDSVALIQKYADEYGISGELYLHEKNQGLLRTILDAYHLLDTKYFTVLDADDYWTSPQKLEKAVKFLEAHDDYSLYFSNVWIESSNGNRHPYFSTDTSSKTFCKWEDSVYFYTCSTVFRNFFTPELLDKMERASKNYRIHICETESLRNLLAYKFGKVYFENSIDAVWRDGGIFNSSSKLERSLMLMNYERQLFEFFSKQFGLNDPSVIISLIWCLTFYFGSLNGFVDMLKQLTITEFKAGKYFRDMFFDYGDSDAEKIINALLEQAKFFKRYGIRIDGNKVIINSDAGTICIDGNKVIINFDTGTICIDGNKAIINSEAGTT